jgi:hypothetical protein
MSSPALSVQITLRALLVPKSLYLFSWYKKARARSSLACLERPDRVTKECLHDAALANIDPKQEVVL